MPYDAPKHHAQQFEQIIATMFTCRSVVKYNLTLGAEQKNELLVDIDTALEMLRAQVITPPPANIEHVQGSHTGLVETNPHPISEKDGHVRQNAPVDPLAEKQTLQMLYRMYHAYLDEEQSPNIHTFVARFNEVMSIMNDVQRALRSSYNPDGHQDLLENLLQRLQVFVADLYYTFMDFIHVLSNALQQNNVNLDTEKLSPVQDTQLAVSIQDAVHDVSTGGRDLASLCYAYDTHQQLNRLKGHLSNRVCEGTAFLNFLQQRVEIAAGTQKEVLVQLNAMAELLYDMSLLLAEYEKAASLLI